MTMRFYQKASSFKWLLVLSAIAAGGGYLMINDLLNGSENRALDDRIKQVSHKVLEVREAPERLEVVYLNDRTQSSSAWIEGFFEDALNIAVLAKDKAYPELVFLVQTPAEDAGDGSRATLGMSVVYDGSALDSLALRDATVHQFADMPKQVHYQRLGRIKAQEYCNDAGGYKYTPRLCGFLVEGYIKGRRLN
ncbi:hypothetical protein [Methylobacillus sp. Pita1]|uniref:hypothetical protein n=1 Tax=Methylobacillus sp. Pita1 TaxID=3382642 RepID=UPI0038B5B52D